jgi:hypothetical protein
MIALQLALLVLIPSALATVIEAINQARERGKK